MWVYQGAQRHSGGWETGVITRRVYSQAYQRGATNSQSLISAHVHPKEHSETLADRRAPVTLREMSSSLSQSCLGEPFFHGPG